MEEEVEGETEGEVQLEGEVLALNTDKNEKDKFFSDKFFFHKYGNLSIMSGNNICTISLRDDLSQGTFSL